MSPGSGNLDFSWSNIFEELREVSQLQDNVEQLPSARKRLLFLLENIEKIPNDLRAVTRDLLCSFGYFPYLDKIDKEDFKTELNKEFHRSDVLPEIVLHKEQFLISELLNARRSVILSAPTSFGKTLLIEEVIARKKYNNIVIIEPTLALIDELRSKLKKYDSYYKIIFSKNQSLSSRNIFLLTQERVVEFEELPEIDFFVIDEFYKLSIDDDERTDTLNHAFYLLLKKTTNFYLLGPPVKTIPVAFLTKYKCDLKINNFETVNVTIKTAGLKTPENLYNLLHGLTEQTLVYCRGPDSCETLANNFLGDASRFSVTNANDPVIDWIKSNLHDDWSLVKLLRHGIAFHHSGLPRHISRHLVESFNKGQIKYLFCTTTLIEGVNTSAKNVVVYDEKKGPKLLTKFDLRNIAGRAGRMNQYLSGTVFMFISNPTEDTEHVDIPWYSQENVSDSLLIQLDDLDLKPPSKARVDKILENPHLTGELLRKNSNIQPSGQIALAERLKSEPALYQKLAWTTYPNYSELLTVCNLIWTYLVRRNVNQRMVDGILSEKQLAFATNRYRITKVPHLLIKDYLEKNPSKTVDDAVSTVMKWIRKWFGFRMPKLLMSLHNIQEVVYSEQGRQPGNYKFFAAELENGFLPPGVSTLRELGIPEELGHKIIRSAGISHDADVDFVINTIRGGLDHSKFSEYEKMLLKRI